MINNRIKEIKQKGFSMSPATDNTINIYENNDTFNPIDFSKIKVGAQTLDDAVLELGSYKKINPNLGDKKRGSCGN